MSDFNLTIITQEQNIFEGLVTEIILPGVDGYFGVLAYHAAMISVLGNGRVVVKKDNNSTSFEILGGFFEIADNKAIILADKIDPPKPVFSF